MSWGVSDRLKSILGLVDKPMEYGAVEDGMQSPEQEMTPDKAFDAVLEAMPVREFKTEHGIRNQFDVGRAEYRLAKAVLSDYQAQRESGQPDLVNMNNIRRGESPQIKADKEIFTKAKMSRGYLDIDTKAHRGELTHDQSELKAALDWYDRNLNQPPYTLSQAEQVIYDYQEAKRAAKAAKKA